MLEHNLNIKNDLNFCRFQKHPFHMVDPSPWPFFSSFGAFSFLLNFALWFHGYSEMNFVIICFIFLVSIMIFWWRDVVRESTFLGCHTRAVQMSLKIGFVLFIISEIMFFFSFFWAFFHSSLSPVIEIGSMWPPHYLRTISPFGIPLLNTIVLLTSGMSITLAHKYMFLSDAFRASRAVIITILLAIFFTCIQLGEYILAPFGINDGIYGSVFYMITGFHGFHVLIGTIFIFVCLIRLNNQHFSRKRHLGFEFAAWYWHFVDVVWLFVFIFLYWWGNLNIDF